MRSSLKLTLGISLILIIAACTTVFVLRGNDETANDSTQAPDNNSLNVTSANTARNADAASQQVQTTPYSKLPAKLQSAILTATKKNAPACLNGDQIVDYSGKAVDQAVKYAEGYAADATIGCDSGGHFLYVYESDGSWKEVVSGTQDVYKCSIIQQYNIPPSVYSGECLEENGSRRQL